MSASNAVEVGEKISQINLGLETTLFTFSKIITSLSKLFSFERYHPVKATCVRVTNQVFSH